MKSEKNYLDTSVINFLFADDAPEKKEITIDFFDNFIKTGVYQAFISNIVLQEINQTPNPEKKAKLLGIIDSYFTSQLELTHLPEIQGMAKQYLENAVLPKNKLFDALHVACAVVHQFDYLVSWNYKHLANVQREKKVTLINFENGYVHPFRIITPIDLIDYGI